MAQGELSSLENLPFQTEHDRKEGAEDRETHFQDPICAFAATESDFLKLVSSKVKGKKVPLRTALKIE